MSAPPSVFGALGNFNRQSGEARGGQAQKGAELQKLGFQERAVSKFCQAQRPRNLNG
jgi:hypothetical protein